MSEQFSRINIEMTDPEFKLTYPGRLEITKKLTEKEFLLFSESFDIKTRDMKTGWIWYSLPKFTDSGFDIGIALGFNCGRLDSITVSDVSEKFGSARSENNEKLRAASMGSWFVKIGFPQGSYVWGDVWAGFDEKDGVGSGWIKFSESRQI